MRTPGRRPGGPQGGSCYLTIRVVMGRILTHNGMQRKAGTDGLFARRPVFSLEEATREFAPPGGRAGTVARLKHHVASGRLKVLARGVYAVVPRGTAPAALRPDPFLVAAAARPDAVFSHHAAIELLGAAHSVWNDCTAYSSRRRRPIELDGTTVRFLDVPGPMEERSGRQLGTRKVERLGRLLEITGPERTLVEGFRRPRLAGGLEELVQSAAGFTTLDFDLLGEVLERYGVANLWAATGWFLERTCEVFHVPDAVLERHERSVPRSAQYLDRGRRGGTLHRRWNLIVPAELERLGGPDER